MEVLRSVDLLGQEFTLPAGGAEKQYVLDGCDDVETDEVDLDQLRSWVIDRRSIHQVQVPWVKSQLDLDKLLWKLL